MIEQNEDLKPYRMFFGLTMLQFLAGLAVAGFALTAVLNYIF